MSDLISRQAAIEAIHNYWKKRYDTLPLSDIQQIDKILEHNKTLCNFIKSIPSADRPQGEWINKQKGFGIEAKICSACGVEKNNMSNFCPNCGADMRGGTDD